MGSLGRGKGRRKLGTRPEGLADPRAHVGKPAAPLRHRRLRVEAEENSDGSFPAVRNVYLESALVPPGFMTPANTTCELFAIGLACRSVVDLVRWADKSGLYVTYEPPGNMAGYFRPKARTDEQYLFDVG